MQPALALVPALAPRRAALGGPALAAVRAFLRPAEEKGVCAAEAAELAKQYAQEV